MLFYVLEIVGPGADSRKFLVGPFDKKPSPQDLLDVFGNDYPEEADALEDQGLNKKPLGQWATKVEADPEEPSSYEL